MKHPFSPDTRPPDTYLYHYTSASTFLEHILPNRSIQFSPMSQVNDPKESRFSAMLYSSGLETVALKELHNRLRQFHESRVKVACFSQDDPGIAIFAHQTFQGWAKPAMWAHYGGDHTGVCVVFNQRSLVKSFCTKFAGHTRIFHGNMNYQQIKAISPKYLETQYETHKVHIRANETLADFETTVLEYLNKHHGAMYFCKHGDWSGEREYRLLVVSPKMDSSTWISPIHLLAPVQDLRCPNQIAAKSKTPVRIQGCSTTRFIRGFSVNATRLAR